MRRLVVVLAVCLGTACPVLRAVPLATDTGPTGDTPTTVATATGSGSGASANASIPVWGVFEAALQAAGSHGPDPYHAVSLNATFRLVQPGHNHNHSRSNPTTTATTYTLPGFWDGGRVWRVRFAAPVAGRWAYEVVSRPHDAGLEVAGSFQAVGYAGSNSNYQHGFLRASPNSRYLEHFDGTPFYWLGDTHWSGFQLAEHWAETNNDTFGPSSMFKDMVDARVAQGYSVWKAETFVINDESGNAAVNDGGGAWLNGSFFNVPSPGFWQAVDRRIAYVASKGLAISFAGFGIGRGMPDDKLLAASLRLVEYLVGRYAAFPVVWISCQEYCTAMACASCWAEVAARTYALDPYHRANSLHNCATNPISFHDKPWYTHVTLQQGHNRNMPFSYWLDQYKATPARPILEDEANYELLAYHGGVEHGPAWMTRQAAWMSQIAGAFGFTYGGQGIWWACWNTTYTNSNCGVNGSPNYRTWFDTLDFEVGGRQLTYMQRFFTGLAWWTLAPDAAAITWSPEAPAPTSSQAPFQKATADRTTVVAYLPTGAAAHAGCDGLRYNGTVEGLDPRGVFSAHWFDPRLGTYALIASHITGVGSWSFPAQPNASLDWVLLFRASNSSSSRRGGEPGKDPHKTVGLGSEARTPSTAVGGQVINGSSWAVGLSLHGRLRTLGGLAGCNLTVGPQPVEVTALGRFRVAGNRFHQALSLVEAHSGAVLATATVEMRGSTADRLGFVYQELPAPVRLAANQAYLLVAAYSDCDACFDDEHTQMTTSSAARLTGSVYGGGGAPFKPGGGGAGTCYGPLNLLLAPVA